MKNHPLRSHVLNFFWLLLFAFLAPLAGAQAAGPMIAVFTGASTAGVQRVNNGPAYDFGYTGTTTNARVQTFTIKNTGDADLTGLALSRAGGSTPDDFKVGNLGATTLGPGASTTFTVTISPAGAGKRSSVVSITSNDASTPSFAIPVIGYGIVLTFENGKLTGARDVRLVSATENREDYRFSFRFTGGSGTANPDAIVKQLDIATVAGMGNDYLGYLALQSIVYQALVGDFRQRPSLISGCDSDDFLDLVDVGRRSGVTVRGSLFHRSIQNPGGIVTDTLGARGGWIIVKSAIPSHLHVPNELYPELINTGRGLISDDLGNVVIFEGAGTGGQELADNGASPNLGTPDPTGPVTTQTFTVKYAMTPEAIARPSGIPPLADFAVSVHGLNPDKYTVNMTGTTTTLGANATTTFTVTAQPGLYSGVVQIDSAEKRNGGGGVYVVFATNTLRMNVGFAVPAGPTVTAISPTSGSTAGGTSVTITGTGFTGATGVTIGGTAATSVTVVSATSITCTTPAGTVGPASVVVTTPGGANAANTLFTYVAPALTITTVTGPSAGSYKAGQALSFTVNFSAAVSVSGTPQLPLTIGSTARNATYASGSPGTALTFTYEVQAGDTDTDGIASASPLALNTGTIKAGATDATLTFTPPTTTTVLVDTTAPTISLGAPSASSTATGPITYTVTYADAAFNASTLAVGNITLNKTGTADGTVAVTGSGTTRTVTLSGIIGTGTLGITVAAGTASDMAGNLAPATSASATFTVDSGVIVPPNGPPAASDANYTRGPRQSLKILIADLIASHTSDPEGDARSLTSLGSPTGGGAVSQSGGYIFYMPPAGDGNDSIHYTVSDNQSRTASANILITRVTPGGLPQSVSVSGGNATVSFAGIPGFYYAIERSLDMMIWTPRQTIMAPANGQFQYVDDFSDLGSPPPQAYYRTREVTAP